jgi:hypothetical protein
VKIISIEKFLNELKILFLDLLKKIIIRIGIRPKNCPINDEIKEITIKYTIVKNNKTPLFL